MSALRFECPHCRQPLAAPEEAAGLALACPACHQDLRIPASAAPDAGAPSAPASEAPAPLPNRPILCPMCLSPVGPEEPRSVCPACRAEYHQECWQENGGCAVYGCSQAPVAEPRRAIEIPVSYWGQEKKPCPVCAQEILAAAIRCRHCGATFDSARPEDAGQFQQRAELKQRLPAVRRTVLWLFVICLLPFLAPVGAVWGAVWYPTHRDEVKGLPSFYTALCQIGLAVAVGQTLLFVIMALLFAAIRGSS